MYVAEETGMLCGVVGWGDSLLGLLGESTLVRMLPSLGLPRVMRYSGYE